MTILLPGYQLSETLYEGDRTVIYRGLRESASTSADKESVHASVIVKTISSEYPTLEEISRLRHEYKIIQPLAIAGVVKPYELKNYQHNIALVLEDFTGLPLKQFIATQTTTLIDFLTIAINLAQTLGELHSQHIIHKDIKPHNILINPQTGEIKLIDFSISSRLSKENPTIINPNLLEGTLAYMSPEQTGRMNRCLDYRTDFYSLGVTFYEMLTGTLPCTSTDPMELVHYHIAKTPVPPCQNTVCRISTEVPEAISAIVMKLLSKTAEDRYQSAFGLKADLEKCLAQLQTTGKIENFLPGRLDKFGQFHIPQKLYGRANEVTTLMEAFERVAGGASEMILVSGYSGIGKTSVVNEVHKPIVGARGYFIAGKYDQFKRNIPYAALTQAFSELIRQLLTETPAQIAIWKEKLLTAIGNNGQVIIDVIPEVELIIGKQPDVPHLEPTESQNRFNRVFKQFLNVFTSKHPLVLFLDDLQWADTASLKLIELLITDLDSQYFLLIGAYRDNEVSSAHPLMLSLEEIQKTGAKPSNIVLRPLNFVNVSLLIADTLGEFPDSGEMISPRHRVFPLAELLFNKTQGNPFFLTQLFKTLHVEKLLNFDFQEGRWLWDIEKIQALGITDYNIVELIARNIQKLPEETQQVLKLAACIGNTFNLDTLAIVNQKSILTTADELWEALQSGLILPLSQAYKIPLFFDKEQQGSLVVIDELKINYKFLHDRVQQAAYSLIPADEKKITHLKIGQLLLQKFSGGFKTEFSAPTDIINQPKAVAVEENIFDIVNQLNIGLEFITESSQKQELSSLNLIAGRKAKAATAFEGAVRYLNIGLGLLPENCWQSHYELTLTYYIEAAEAEYLNINFARAAMLAEIALHESTSLLDKVKVYELQMQICIAQLEMIQAVDIGLKVLEKLGISLAIVEGDTSLIIQLPNPTELKNMPVMTDPYKLSAMRILKILCAPVFMAKPEIFPQLIISMVNLCIEYGNSALSAYAYGFYGLLMVGFGQLDVGYRAGNIALKLLEQFDAKDLKAKVYNLYNSNIRTWKEHARNSIIPLQEGVQSGLETGDIEWGGYSAANLCSYLFFTEENLSSAVQQQAIYVDLSLKIKQQIPIHFSQIWRQLGLNLQGEAADKLLLVGESFNETQLLPRLIATKSGTVLFIFYVAKTILLYLFKNYSQALDNVALANEQAGAAFGFIQVAILNFYHSLALLGQYHQVDSSKQKQYLQQVQENQQKMQHWAHHAPMNFQHKYDLVEAEKARVLGLNWEAAQFYDRAIKSASENSYIQEKALANELAAEFYVAISKPQVAKAYITEAYYSYIHWGAVAKVKDLDQRHSELIFRSPKTETNNIDLTQTSSTTTKTGQLLDLTTVIKASIVLSSEIILSNLLDKMMKIVIENAGASIGFFITLQQGKWVVEAIGTSEDEQITVSTPNLTPSDGAPRSAGSDRLESLLPLSLLNYVEITREKLVIDDATNTERFAADPYIIVNQPKSILCSPLIHSGKLTGILYLENNLLKGAFIPERLKVLNLLSAQISISIENARLYQREQEKSQQLEQSLNKLQQTQSQLVQTEKISSLGQLVAGVAHEVNNPVSFINGNIHHANQYVSDLLTHLQLYQKHLPNPPEEIAEHAEEIDMEYLVEDLPKMLSSMKLGTERIKDIMLSLRNFSRTDGADAKPTNIQEGLDSTLMILHHRLKATGEFKEIKLVKEYGSLPPVECYAGQLNQVFMNLLANAIDAMEEDRKISEKEIRIRTELLDENKVVIRIKDNGAGMTEDIHTKLFAPFFTTKPAGKGTGLGLSISHQIVVEKHKGKIYCLSTPGAGAEFVIEIPLKQAA